ncbi:hypothetical protein Tco_1343511 [Tanacetum coccineum]
MENLKQHYLDEMLSLSNDLHFKDYRNEKIDIHFRRECESIIDELKGINTIPKKESNEFIKFNVEDLVLIPSESEDTSESDSDCDLPSCDDFSPINIYEEKSVTFSNPLFDSNDDFTSSDDEPLSDKDVPEENDKTYSNPLFEFDDEYISSAINPHFDEDFENGYHDSEGDIIYLESLLIDDTIPNLPPEVFLDNDLRSFKDELDKEDLKSMVKVFDFDIHENTFSPTYVKLPFEDRHYLSFTYVIGNFFLISPIRWNLLFFSPPGVKTPFLTRHSRF